MQGGVQTNLPMVSASSNEFSRSGSLVYQRVYLKKSIMANARFSSRLNGKCFFWQNLTLGNIILQLNLGY